MFKNNFIFTFKFKGSIELIVYSSFKSLAVKGKYFPLIPIYLL